MNFGNFMEQLSSKPFASVFAAMAAIPLSVAGSSCLPADSGVTLLSSAQCSEGCMDECGVCGGDGSSCKTLGVIMLVILALLIFAMLVIWGKFLRVQVLYDAQVKTAERSISNES